MSDDKTPIDRAVELLVYAPVGLAMTARDMLPGFIERGRQQITNQVGMARVVGQFAVQQGQSEAERAFNRARHQAQSALEQLGAFGGGGNGSTQGRSTPTSAASPPPATAEPAPAPPEAAPTVRSGPGAAALAIPDYDSLSASQVVPRLSSLGEDELEAVRDYEAAHRGRKTILNKIAQLQQA